MAFLLVLTEDPSSGLQSISLDRVLLTAPEGPVPQTPRREVQLLRHGAAGPLGLGIRAPRGQKCRFADRFGGTETDACTR